MTLGLVSLSFSSRQTRNKHPSDAKENLKNVFSKVSAGSIALEQQLEFLMPKLETQKADQILQTEDKFE